MDGVIHRALDPDPAKRFSTVKAMLEEIERIERTPPRYSGTPRITRAVRFMDAAWTVLGLFLFFGAAGILSRVEKWGFGLPVDLIGENTIRIGTYQGILVLLVFAALSGLWQLFRLSRFRKVPLREALPSPFGLKLGTTRIAALVVFLSQFLFLIAPGVFGAVAWRETCSYWLKEGDAPWVQGFVVTEGYRGMVAHDPWQWPEEGKEYSLRERSGWITDPLSTQLDHTSFIPGLVPRILAGLAIFFAATVAITILSAFARWWRFRKWGRTAVLMALLGLTVKAVQAENRRREDKGRREGAGWVWDYNGWTLEAHTSKATGLRGWLLPGDSPPQWEVPPPEVLAQFAGSVDFGEGMPRTGPAIAEYLTAHAARSRALQRNQSGLRNDVQSDGPYANKRFVFHSHYEDFTDPQNAPATGSLTILVLHGNVFPGLGAEITSMSLPSLQLWSVEPCALTPADAAAWAEAFFDALHTVPATGQPDPLHPLFLPQMLHFNGGAPKVNATPREAVLDSLRAICARGAHPVLARPPGPAKELSGGRRRLTLEIEDRGQPAKWNADLIFTDGRWQCVKLVF